MKAAPKHIKAERKATEAMKAKVRELLVCRKRMTVAGHNSHCTSCHQFSGRLYRPGVCPGMATRSADRPCCWMDPETKQRPALMFFDEVSGVSGCGHETRGAA